MSNLLRRARPHVASPRPLGILLPLFAALASPAMAGETLHLRCGARVDAENAQLLGPATLVVEGGKLRAIEPAEAALPAGAREIDLRGHTCMPGLMDMHVHLAGEYSRRSYLERFILNPTDRAIRAVVNAKKTLDAG
ncbi:MAG: hypothetical protein JRH10_09255, partial [Deltaproteobacteria bacterium]|nr:hypothetical protein [Deltaproteobacteria bacterium]